ncbi:MAG: hypothetical protein R3D44_12655 [Hyphomicrobiaceae bacterium]
MKGNFHETIEEAAVELPSDRSTGLVLAGAALAVAIVWRTQPALLGTGLVAAAALATLSLTAPTTLNPLNRAWMGLAGLMSKVVSPIAMLVLFCTTVVPFGLVMQLKRDPLRRRPTSADETFWIVPEIKFGPNDMTRPF